VGSTVNGSTRCGGSHSANLPKVQLTQLESIPKRCRNELFELVTISGVIENRPWRTRSIVSDSPKGSNEWAKEIPDIDSVIHYARKKLMLQTRELGE
jgi:hypothetical protein